MSIQARNNVVGHGGDVYMRVISYFGMFLPIGAVFSVDSAFKRGQLQRESKRFSVTNLATVAAILQVSFLYVFSYMHKTGDEWRVDYTASFYALQLDYFRTFLADFIVNFPNVLKVLTYSVLYYEGYGMLACVFPVWTSEIKTLGAMGFTMLHIGFAMFMRLGIFSPVCVTGTLLLYPAWFWDKIFNRLRRNREWVDFKIYYSGRLGYYITGLVSTFFLLPDVEVGPFPHNIDDESVVSTKLDTQSNPIILNGANINPTVNLTTVSQHQHQYQQYHNQSSIYTNGVVETSNIYPGNTSNWIYTKDHKGIKYTGFKALVSICKASPLLWYLTPFLHIRFIAASVKRLMNLISKILVSLYELKSNRPYSNSNISSTTDSTMMFNESTPDEAAHFHRQLQKKWKIWKIFKKVFLNGLAILSIYLALGWNCSSVQCVIPVTVPQSLNGFALALRVDQQWSMFSPRPPQSHWWYTFEGELDDGTPMELWNNDGLFTWKGNIAPYSRDKPDPYPSCIGNHRWFKVYENLNSGNGYELIRLGLGRWVCREWNLRYQGDDRLYKFNIIYRNEKQNLDNTRSPLNDIVLWTHVCYDKST